MSNNLLLKYQNYENLYIIFIANLIQMFPYSSFTPMYCPIYFVPNVGTTRNSAYHPMIIYPQMMQQGVSYEHHNQIPAQQNAGLPQNQAQVVEINSEQQVNGQKAENSQEEPKANQQNSTLQKNKNQNKHLQKPKRPLTYLTQRAFYMKQKIKGKIKSDRRILRKRSRPKQVKKTQVNQKRKQNLKKRDIKAEKKKIISKITKIKILKAPQKVEKPKRKSTWVYTQSVAKIPNLMEFDSTLNQYLQKKKGNLFKRKMICF